MCSIRVATTKDMKKAYTECVMWPSTAGAGGQHSHFTELENAISCIRCSIVLDGIINHFCHGSFLRVRHLSFLSEVISQDSSGSVVKDVGVRYGSNSSKLFSTFFVHALLEYLDPAILNMVGNFVITP